MRIIIEKGRLLDPANKLDGKQDLFIAIFSIFLCLKIAV